MFTGAAPCTALRKSLDIYIKLEGPGLLYTQQKPQVKSCAIGERGSERDRAGRERRVEAPTVWLRGRLLQSCSLHSDVRSTGTTGRTVNRHNDGG